MFGALDNAIKSSCRKLGSIKCCAQFESIRHYRKPRWIPIAKSKMYKVIELKPQPKMEAEELGELNKYFKLYNRSLWSFQSEISREIELTAQKEASQVSEEVELERMMKMNDAENERVRQIREAAVVEEWKQVEKEILEIKRQKEEEELAKLERTEKMLEAEIERVKGAIKLEDLDEAIDKALAVEHDYNFAVTKKGQFLLGRYNSTEFTDGPPPVKPVVKQVEVAK